MEKYGLEKLTMLLSLLGTYRCRKLHDEEKEKMKVIVHKGCNRRIRQKLVVDFLENCL
jgi:hypothetical protein